MGFKKWVVADIDKQLAKELSYECDIDPFVALIAASRGYKDVYELEQFISDEPYFTDFYQMTDINTAADIINSAIENNKKIAVYGDYDCDGVTATAILISYLKSRNADCIFYIPDRFSEGYGMNEAAVKYLYEQKAELVITVDNGILSFDEIKLAKSLGMSVVVTDHHLPSQVLPEADAVVNPHRKDCPSEFKEICGAEVVFRLICVLDNKEPEEIIDLYADILAVGVIADIMPLTLENRTIVKCGMEKIRTGCNIGISALLSVAGIERDSINSSKIAFGICPRINAAGRMGKADRAVSLLTTDNMMTALSLANDIDADNALRQKTEKEIFEEAVFKIEKEKLMFDRVIVVSGDNWHHGVIGIVASKISEKYGVPSIVISSEGELSTGSGRGIEGFNLYEAINSCKDILLKFGGHSQAAGITLRANDINEFKNRINQYALSLDYVPPLLHLDCKLNPSALSVDLAFALKALEPFGVGNKPPLFGVFGAVLERITPIGNNKHLRLLFSKGNNSFQALLFGVSANEFCFEAGDCLDLAVTVEPNFFKGEYTVSVQIKAIRINGTDDDRLFKDYSAFCDFSANREYDTSDITPTREEIGIIYKKICNKEILADRIKYLYINSLGVGKTLAILEILKELQLIEIKNGVCRQIPTLQKTNLYNSTIFKKLTERSGNNA